MAGPKQSHTRRSDSISHVSIELREDRYDAEWPRLAWVTGVWEAGMWRHKAICRIEAAIHFRSMSWGWRQTQDRTELVIGDWQPMRYVEYWEHWVYASCREAAIGCLVRDLKTDPRHEIISHAAIYRVRMPLSREEVAAIEQINTRLVRERPTDAQFEKIFGRPREMQKPKAPTEHRQRQLAFA